MRTIRLRRVLVLVGAALGLLATAVPPAHATTTTSVTFQGDAFLSAGLSYPCVLDATINTSKCPTVTTSPTTTKPVVVTGGHTRGFTFNSTVCVGASATTNLPHLSAGAGLCVITAAGVVTGSCGLSSGLGGFILKIDKTIVLVGPPTQVLVNLLTIITGTFHFTGVGGTLVVTGTTSSGGTVAGEVTAVPPPTPTVPPGTIGNSCSTKTATHFIISGEVAAIEP